MKNILIGVTIVAIFAGYFWYKNLQNKKQIEPLVTVETQESVESKLEQTLGVNIEDTGEKLELSNSDSLAVVSKVENKSGVVLNIIADLPESESPYEVWMESNDKQINLGELTENKGGFVLQTKSYPAEEIGVITIKNKEEVVLQGEF